jgi:plasmid stabilization system protein ParE
VKWRLVIRSRAETDLREAQNWYENQRTGLGAEFLAEIDATIRVLIRDPQRHPVYYRGFRRVLTRRFPYKLFYRLEDDRVIIFRVLHVRRDHPRLLRPRH